MSNRPWVIMIALLMLTGIAVANEEAGPGHETKELSGMSIVGNDEAPKSLYIIPWKSSELGDETSLNMMMSEKDMPIDRDIFIRQLQYYAITKSDE